MRKSLVTDEEAGRVAWDAYSAAVGGKAFNGDPLPSWDVMCKDEKKTQLVVAWKKAGRAVAALVERKLPEPSAPPAPLAITGAPSGRVAGSPSMGGLAALVTSSAPAPVRTLDKRTKCCGSWTLSLRSASRYICPCGDHVEAL